MEHTCKYTITYATSAAEHWDSRNQTELMEHTHTRIHDNVQPALLNTTTVEMHIEAMEHTCKYTITCATSAAKHYDSRKHIEAMEHTREYTTTCATSAAEHYDSRNAHRSYGTHMQIHDYMCNQRC